MDQPEPKVCVGIFTYNHQDFLRQALDSVLSQETSFDFEVLVHDDCSTDGTREIVQEYVAAHPGKVRAILQDENQFSQGRRIVQILLAGMSGKYFALLDGDDFWNGARKLQMQADFLDAHPGCALCQTQTLYYNDTTGRAQSIFPPRARRRERQECADLAQGNFIQMSAVMFREASVPEFPLAFHSLKFGDYPLFALLAQSGWIGYIDEPMVTYRIHANNLWVGRSLGPRLEATREMRRFLAEHLKPELREPWIAAAKAPLIMRAFNRLYYIEDWVRHALGMAPR